MPTDKVELVNKGYMLRRDQVDEIEQLTTERPGASLSDIVRDIVDAGIPEYRRRRALMRTLPERSV